ncbi:zona pellucida-like domain-containing protein 1 [Engraulis encrasicolus]|uniref:zona pellucida-like domain-containing protein 1 n=1 Tax=Engraulis encrasicolus TaxID=184585 RepID=UPI002FD481E9
MLFLCCVLLSVVLRPVFTSNYSCSADYERVPDNNDLSVDCGTSAILLEVNLCTAEWSGFDPNQLALNGEHNNSLCQGTIDTSVDPPVIRYQLHVNHTDSNPCRQSLQIVTETPDPDSAFSHFSSIQSVVITGFIDTPRSSVGIISYSTDLYYHFSCRYPLEYLINNTQIMASSVSVATSDNNGTFIDTLRMNLYNDSGFDTPLAVPSSGLELRTPVFVEVKAINLTGNFHLLLDHCFATPTAYSQTNQEKHDFFIGCDAQPKTTMLKNGLGKNAQFSFEAFRFVQHRDQDKSSIYVHCILRLCEPDKCQEVLNMCNSGSNSGRRRRRDVTPFGSESAESATVTMGPIYTKTETGETTREESKTNVVGVVVGVIFATAGAVLLVLAGWFTLKKYYWGGGLVQGFD